jgi:predicted ArsR family transcriptional regulator
MQQQIEWRRDKVLELSSQGHSQTDIADTLHVNKPVINRDMAYLKQQAGELEDTHSGQAAGRISKLYDWNKPGIENMLGDCEQI